MTYETILSSVRDVIADTFGAPITAIDETTVAEDVDGWDSLNHTILMVRLSRRFNVTIDEDLASDARTVGDLARRLFVEMAVGELS